MSSDTKIEELKKGIVHLWVYDLSLVQDRVLKQLSEGKPASQIRADSGFPLAFGMEDDLRIASALRLADKAAFIAGRMALGHALAWYVHQDGAFALQCNPHGKPYLEENQGVFFNMSHHGKHAALAFAASEIGVDIELVPERSQADLERDNLKKKEVVKQFFAPDEQEMLSDKGAFNELQQKEWCSAFMRMWTRKEALVKAWGQSIASHSLEANASPDFCSYLGKSYSIRTLDVSLLTGRKRSGEAWLSLAINASNLVHPVLNVISLV